MILWYIVPSVIDYRIDWLRGPDSNRRPSAYETDEMPTFPPRDRTIRFCLSKIPVKILRFFDYLVGLDDNHWV